MSVRIEIFRKDEASPLIAAVQSLRGRALGPIARALRAAAEEIVHMARDKRFSGKGPFPPAQNKLGVRSGRLRSSIRTTLPQINEATGELSISMGSNVKYFAIHEFGYEGTVRVRGHTRRLLKATFSRGKLSRRYQNELKKRLARRHFEGKGAGAGTGVKSHTRKMKVPARRPLGTAIESPEAAGVMRGKIKRAMHGMLRRPEKPA